MTFESDLRRELASRGVDSRRIRRIVSELEDHLACDPDAQLGSPSFIATRFAEELRLSETRRATYGGFFALAVTAALLFAAVAASGAGAAGGTRGLAAALAGIAIVVACQVAFVGGVLALWLLLRGDGDVRLVQRRMLVALGAGAVVVLAEGVQAAMDRSSQPGWWFALAVVATVVPAFGLAASARVLRRASTLAPGEPVVTTGMPLWFVVGTGVVVFSAMTLGSGAAESSAVEGLMRGGFEIVAFTVCFVTLGRFLGLRPSIRHATVTTSRR